VGYDDSDKRIPDMTIINRQLGIDSYLLLYIYIYSKAFRFRSIAREFNGL